MPIDLAASAAVLATALGCGLLIGIERERRKGTGPGRAFAGLRTFALTCVVGAVAALTGLAGLMVAGALLVAGLAGVAYWRDRSEDPGATTEIALLLTYLIGVLCVWSLPLAAAIAVGLTALLAGREPLHRFANHWLSHGEVRDGIILAALVLMALPLVPNRPFWGPVLNPYLIVQLLALLLAVQSVAHLCRRLLQAREAVAFSALASGFVSSTATIATMGLAVREGRSGARLMAGGGLVSCVSTQVQILLVAAAVQPVWVTVLWMPTLVGAFMAAAWGWWLLQGAPAEAVDGAGSSPRIEGLPGETGDRMFSLQGAALVVVLLSAIQALVHGLDLWLGEAGLIGGTMIASLADLHAAMAAVFASSGADLSSNDAVPVMLALAVHAGSKSVTAGLVGGRRYLLWLAPGLWAHTLLVIILLAWVA
ncbi:hypothetical protein LPB72_12425 [Hydrogenophaga crassostreae]|uniref:Uncharacterized protein n=1 Tax=Hydrogenophaga crassostreae TaxID=1763535 RepID=A0A167HP68_9BURK|nr:hypothetical protein LPB072_20760 [Hydrogenophaga crassostreae]OAD41523.1 hypothetical protein LPB72_12425 [Hydrogenophaga crassostreae]